MTEQDDQARDQIDISRWLPSNQSGERIDDLWRQVILYKTFADGDILESKARRAQAEAAQDEAQREADEATRMVGERIRAEADAKLEAAKGMRDEARSLREEAQAELARVRQMRTQVEKERDRTIADAEKKGQQMLDQAGVDAQRECTEFRRQALEEIKAILARVETVRVAAEDELETQRILSQVAKIRTASSALYTETTTDNGAQPQPAEGPTTTTVQLEADVPATNGQQGDGPEVGEAHAEEASKSTDAEPTTGTESPRRRGQKSKAR